MKYQIEDREQIQQLLKILGEKVIPAYVELCHIKFPGEEEKKLKFQYAMMLKKAMPLIDALYAELSQKVFNQAKDLVLNAKLEGEKGNAEMLAFYLKLKDSFQAALKEGLREN
jgi:hypothetical protein